MQQGVKILVGLAWGLAVLIPAWSVPPQPVESRIPWIYDYAEGKRLAKASGKPMWVVFRCERCEACSDFDRQVVRFDPDVAALAERFVPVRIQSMNGKNIQLFQFEYDISWMSFFMDAEDRFYARYGGREDDAPDGLVSKASLLRTMQQVLELHRQGAVQTRHEPNPEPVFTPEDIPSMHAHMRGQLNRCIHCHDVKAAQLRTKYADGTLTKDDAFTYPPPSTIGLKLDTDRQEQIAEVRPGSAADKAGLRSGDRLVEVDGYRILTVGDLARVLHVAPREAVLPVRFQRDDQKLETRLELSGAWKRTADPSWRSSLHWIGPNGGFWAVPLKDEEKPRLGLAASAMALRVSFFFRNQTAPIRAGLQVNDVLIEVDGIRADWTPRQLHAYLQLHKNYGDKVDLTVLRDGREVKLTLELPEKPTWSAAAE